MSFEKEYLDYFFTQQKQLWMNYTKIAQHDLNKIDDAIYSLLLKHRNLLKYRNQTTLTDRKLEIASAIINRGLVDKHPRVASLRNIVDSIYTTKSLSSDPLARRLELAKNLKPLVLELMILRNSLAKQLGFDSYVHLVMKNEELELDQVTRLVQQYFEKHVSKAKELVNLYNLNWLDWFNQLHSLGELNVNGTATEHATTLLQKLGFANVIPKISFNVAESNTWAGYVGVLSVPNDIRVMARPTTSLSRLRTFCHEIGHTLAHALNEQEGLYTTWTHTYDEAMAVVIEHLGTALLLNNNQFEKAKQVAILENVRCCISYLFELALWEDPDNAEKLYVQHYEMLGMPIKNPSLWAADSFRSLDPVYNHNYVLGAIVAEKTSDYLLQEFDTTPPRWGTWLVDNYYAQGRKVPLRQKVRNLSIF